jgi:sulfur relay (sulfurtransferase) complex TusBCD TusD component (DsrE family)
MKVCPFSEAKDFMGESFQAKYLELYLTDLKAATVVIEDQYIDKDFLIDYSNYHVRSFDGCDKFTTRLHFFKEDFSQEEFTNNFFDNIDFREKLQGEGAYLGFVVVKPIGSQENHPFIGRTLLKTYDLKDGKKNRFYITHEYTASLCGLELKVESLPYQMQDSIVAACATTAIWTSVHALNMIFGVPKHSPFEITKISVGFPGNERNFPSGGLNQHQMKYYFNSIGIESEIINAQTKKNVLPLVIRSYLDYKIPIIACLVLEEKRGFLKSAKRRDYHAVVISGYKLDSMNEMIELYIHDDRIGPYSRVEPNKGDKTFTSWKNEWIDNRGYTDVYVEQLIVPLYPKIRLSFNKIYELYCKVRDNLPNINGNMDFDVDLFLTDVRKYKKDILDKDIYNKSEALSKPLPKYFWVIRVEKDGTRIFDKLLDATSLFHKEIPFIAYMSDQVKVPD